MTMDAMTTGDVLLTPVAPYDFAVALAYIRGAHWAVLERATADVYRRAVRLLGRDVLLELRSIGTPEQPRLLLRVTAADVDEALLTAAAAQVRRTFALEDDPAPFLALAADDPVFQAVARDAGALRPVIIASPYEAVLWAIIGQQINVAFAATLKRALVALAGHTFTVEGEDYPLLPPPEVVAQLDPADLRARQFSGQKTAYILGISTAIVDGALDLAHLATLPPDDAITALMGHKGIGRWTAECVLMRGMGATDVMPAGDVGLRAAIGQAYDLGRHASEAEVRDHSAAWAGWRGWATFYWWRWLEATKRARTVETNT